MSEFMFIQKQIKGGYILQLLLLHTGSNTGCLKLHLLELLLMGLQLTLVKCKHFTLSFALKYIYPQLNFYYFIS